MPYAGNVMETVLLTNEPLGTVAGDQVELSWRYGWRHQDRLRANLSLLTSRRSHGRAHRDWDARDGDSEVGE
jgi:hypothetical protein